MNRYLSHYAAAYHWKTPCMDVVLGDNANGGRVPDYTFQQRNEISYRKDFSSHLCSLPLPPGSIIYKDGLNVASPELVFVQLANKLDIHRLILLGLQLCSHPPARSEKAITTKENLNTYAEKIKEHRGSHNALRALKYIKDSSASIMESITYMVLTLPNALGGYGLSDPVFNYEIKLRGGSGNRLGQKHCYVDLFYKSEKVAVEYDSFAFHNSPFDQGKDALRSAILERHGIEVMKLNTIQLYDNEACKDFAYNLADRIGKRIQIRTKKFDITHTSLRKLLPTQERSHN